jgi:MFS family permease
MKDLVPEKSLGAYFSRRSRLTQTLNVILSILIALLLDYIKKYYPQYQLYAYAGMFAAGGIIGITGAFILSRASEPQGVLLHDNIFRLLKRPLKDSNFRRLLMFNSAWVFALNIATPFFTVFLLKSLGIALSYVILLGIISQVGSILTIRLWGTFADRYSNKTIIAICAPLYIGCFVAWCFVGIYTHMYVNMALLVLIYIFTGISTAGINLSLINIGLKLAPREESIVYLSAKNVITAFSSSIAPLIGGYLADFFTNRHLNVRIEWGGPRVTKVFRLLELHEWNFLFLIAALLALVALELLVPVKEAGEVEKEDVRRILRKSVRGSLKEYFLIGHLIGWQQQLWSIIKKSLPYK